MRDQSYFKIVATMLSIKVFRIFFVPLSFEHALYKSIWKYLSFITVFLVFYISHAMQETGLNCKKKQLTVMLILIAYVIAINLVLCEIQSSHFCLINSQHFSYIMQRTA